MKKKVQITGKQNDALLVTCLLFTCVLLIFAYFCLLLLTFADINAKGVLDKAFITQTYKIKK